MAWSRILAPVAFSPTDRGATRFAEMLASHFHSQLMLLHVVPPPLGAFSSPEAAAYVTAIDMAEERVEENKAELDRYASSEHTGVRLTEDVLTGDPSNQIVDYAREHHADLIVMATHAYGPLRRFFLGSVTANVVHRATCPVLTGSHLEPAPERSEMGFRRILCAIDLAQGSRAVLEWAGGFAREFGAEVHIVHVLPHSLVESGGVYFDPVWRLEAMSRASEEIRQLQREAGAPGEVQIEIGETAATVNEAARDYQADLLVIGRGSRPGLLGRLQEHAYAILRGSPCPVAAI